MFDMYGKDRLIHVDVARALGWWDITGPHSSILMYSGLHFRGYPPGHCIIIGQPAPSIPYYWEDWEAIGSLIEQFKLTCYWEKDQWNVLFHSDLPEAVKGQDKWLMMAVCRCIVAASDVISKKAVQ